MSGNGKDIINNAGHDVLFGDGNGPGDEENVSWMDTIAI